MPAVPALSSPVALNSSSGEAEGRGDAGAPVEPVEEPANDARPRLLSAAATTDIAAIPLTPPSISDGSMGPRQPQPALLGVFALHRSCVGGDDDEQPSQ